MNEMNDYPPTQEERFNPSKALKTLWKNRVQDMGYITCKCKVSFLSSHGMENHVRKCEGYEARHFITCNHCGIRLPDFTKLRSHKFKAHYEIAAQEDEEMTLKARSTKADFSQKKSIGQSKEEFKVVNKDWKSERERPAVARIATHDMDDKDRATLTKEIMKESRLRGKPHKNRAISYYQTLTHDEQRPPPVEETNKVSYSRPLIDHLNKIISEPENIDFVAKEEPEDLDPDDPLHVPDFEAHEEENSAKTEPEDGYQVNESDGNVISDPKSSKLQSSITIKQETVRTEETVTVKKEPLEEGALESDIIVKAEQLDDNLEPSQVKGCEISDTYFKQAPPVVKEEPIDYEVPIEGLSATGIINHIEVPDNSEPFCKAEDAIKIKNDLAVKEAQRDIIGKPVKLVPKFVSGKQKVYIRKTHINDTNEKDTSSDESEEDNDPDWTPPDLVESEVEEPCHDSIVDQFNHETSKNSDANDPLSTEEKDRLSELIINQSIPVVLEKRPPKRPHQISAESLNRTRRYGGMKMKRKINIVDYPHDRASEQNEPDPEPEPKPQLDESKRVVMPYSIRSGPDEVHVSGMKVVNNDSLNDEQRAQLTELIMKQSRLISTVKPKGRPRKHPLPSVKTAKKKKKPGKSAEKEPIAKDSLVTYGRPDPLSTTTPINDTNFGTTLAGSSISLPSSSNCDYQQQSTIDLETVDVTPEVLFHKHDDPKTSDGDYDFVVTEEFIDQPEELDQDIIEEEGEQEPVVIDYQSKPSSSKTTIDISKVAASVPGLEEDTVKLLEPDGLDPDSEFEQKKKSRGWKTYKSKLQTGTTVPPPIEMWKRQIRGHMGVAICVHEKCNMAFFSLNGIKTHHKSCTGYTRFASDCADCPLRFKTFSVLKKHAKKRHKKILT